MASPEGVIPPRDLQEDANPSYSDSGDEDFSASHYLQEPVAGGRIYPSDSTRVVYCYAAANVPAEAIGEPLFQLRCVPGETQTSLYVCTVRFPLALAGAATTGLCCETIAEARRSASMTTCRKLFGDGLLDYHLFPRPIKNSSHGTRPAAGNHIPNAPNAYAKKQPSFWPFSIAAGVAQLQPTLDSAHASGDVSRDPMVLSARLYPTVVTVASSDGERWAPVVILTRLPLPAMGGFNLFLSGVPVPIRTHQGAPFAASEDRLQSLRRYTVRVCRTLTNKRFVCAQESMAYFLAPLNTIWEEPESGSGKLVPVEEYISWEKVEFATETFAVPLDLANLTEDMQDAVIQDKTLEFTRRYYVIQVRTDMNPLTQPAPGSVRIVSCAHMAHPLMLFSENRHTLASGTTAMLGASERIA